MNLITVAEFRKQVQAHRKPTGGVFRVNMDTPTDVADKSRTKRFTFSDGSVDRMGDTISPDGWDIAHFVRNPVALWAHDSSDPPIGRASNVKVEGRKLMGDIEFAPPEIYAFAETIFRLVAGKFLNAVSVGFLPLEYNFVENDPDRGFGIDFKRQELLEISLCPIPANANALGAARAGGIDTRPLVEWAERALDDRGRVILTRAELNRLRKAAKEPPMPSLRRRRAEDPDDDDKPGEDKPEDKADGKPEGNCGREPDEACGMKDPQECSVHASKATDTDDDEAEDKRFRRLMLRWMKSGSAGTAIRLEPYRREMGEGDEPPVAHEDAIRLAHKCLRTSKAFLTEAVTHHTKAMGLLEGVVGALDDKAEDEPEDEANDQGDGGEPAEDDKAKQLHRAALLCMKHRAA